MKRRKKQGAMPPIWVLENEEDLSQRRRERRGNGRVSGIETVKQGKGDDCFFHG